MSKIALRLSKLAGLFALSLSVAAPAGAAAASNSFATQFPARILAAHNAVRARAGLAPLAWDPTLGEAAAAYAQQMAFTGVFAHSDRSARRGTGENLWMGTRGAFSLETMVNNWASEGRWFRAGVFPNVSSTGNWEQVGHYTQIVWPTTTRVGCALASTSRTDYLVCRYSPAGNVDGRPVG
jgi:cysteine-rich secretory family protein